MKDKTVKAMKSKTASTGRVRRVNRRELIRGVGGIALALPLLEAMQPREARSQAAAPKRFLFFFSPNGNIAKHIETTGTERDFEFGHIHEPLTPYKQDLVAFRNVNNIPFTYSSGAAHLRGTGSLLTGREIIKGDKSPLSASGISVDQELATHDQVVGDTAFRSLELGVRTTRIQPAGAVSYTGPLQVVARENDPNKVFDRLFMNGGGGGGNTEDAERIRAGRQSVLDFVKGDMNRISPRISVEDRQRLELHAGAIRDAESRLQNAGVAGGCAMPDISGANLGATTASRFGDGALANDDQVLRVQMDLMALAVSCDLSRIITLMFGYGGYNQSYSWLGENGAHHNLSHEGNGNTGAQETLTKYNRWQTEQFAYLVDKLKNLPEAGGSVLYNTLALWQNELYTGNQHQANNLPTIVAGNAGGQIETGRYLNFDRGVPHQALLVSVLNAMGVPATTFGDPGNVDGPMPGLLS